METIRFILKIVHQPSRSIQCRLPSFSNVFIVCKKCKGMLFLFNPVDKHYCFIVIQLSGLGCREENENGNILKHRHSTMSYCAPLCVIVYFGNIYILGLYI